MPTAVISKWLGHATASFTMATYVDGQDEALAAAAETLAVLTAPLRAACEMWS
jgi:integrase